MRRQPFTRCRGHAAKKRGQRTTRPTRFHLERRALSITSRAAGNQERGAVPSVCRGQPATRDHRGQYGEKEAFPDTGQVVHWYQTFERAQRASDVPSLPLPGISPAVPAGSQTTGLWTRRAVASRRPSAASREASSIPAARWHARGSASSLFLRSPQ
jgi:hypothetical protein